MEDRKQNFLLDLFKGLLVGVSICLASILIFAFILKLADIGSFWVRLINQIIKLAAVAVACLVSVRGAKGYLKGMAVGVSIIAVTYLLFGLVSGSLSFGLETVWELLYGAALGCLSGIISVNLKK